MKSRSEMVWLSGDLRGLLAKFCRKAGKSKSCVLREAFLWFLKGKAGFELEECLLDLELERLEEESRRLRRMQRLILRDHAYLRPYVEKVMKGGWEDRVKRRPPLPETSGAALSVKALEGIFARRAEVGRLAAKLAVKRWPGKYDVGPVEVKERSQTVFGFVFPFPLCPYWATSRINKQFQGPPDRRHCDMKDKEVAVSVCWSCWNKGMKTKVEGEEEWDSWRKSREYQELREYLDQFDFDDNMAWLRARNSRSVATVNKQQKRGEKQYGSNT